MIMTSAKTRWIIFAALFIVVVLSYTITISLDVEASPEVKKTFEYIDSLPSGSVIIVSFDHEASSLPEIKPIASAIISHAFKNDIKIIGLSLFAEGTAIGYHMLSELAAESGRIYGQDYVFLGFKPQHISAILGMGESIRRIFPEDYLGRPTGSFPMMKNIDNYEGTAAAISLSDGDRGVQWIEYAGARYNQKILAGLTAAMLTTYDPYLNSGQLYAAVGGLRGAAEYEILSGKPGRGNRGLLAQSAAHIFLIALIIVGNTLYFRRRSLKGKG
jgi:hypothetical protein